MMALKSVIFKSAFRRNSSVQKNTGQNAGKPRLDLNVEAAWAQVRPKEVPGRYTGRSNVESQEIV
jgi:hypothetical protein